MKNRLREWRLRSKMTQAQVAQSMGILQHMVSSHETGVRGLSMSRAIAYAQLYGCTLDDLFWFGPGSSGEASAS